MSDLGRRVPTDWKHVEKYPLRATIAKTVTTVETLLKLPDYRKQYDQGSEGACVGFACSWMMSLLNRVRYDARWLYVHAQDVDEWPDTPPGEGTSVRAACDVLRAQGHCRMRGGRPMAPDTTHGIEANRWATTVDEIRTALWEGRPVAIGVNWYENFDSPRKFGNEWWIGRNNAGHLGSVRGGHAVCLYGASDRRQAFRMVNNWGTQYPLVWMPYEVMGRLLREYGEAALVTDR
jgi:hypothetical protein